MTNKTTKSEEKQKLETISFRGRRDLWLKFVYTTKRRKEKNVWAVISGLIKEYINWGDK